MIADVSARIARLRAEPGYGTGEVDLTSQIRRVVIIGSSSRGGSSIFAEILRRTPQLLHLRAEINPFFVVTGRTFPRSGDSDALGVEHADARALSAELAQDAGVAADGLPDVASEHRFAVDLAVRLTLQWPDERFALDTVRAALGDTLSDLRRNHGWARDFPDPQLFHARFLDRIRRDHPTVNPHYYDLPRELLNAPRPDGPPSGFLIEEPPFVTIVPWRRATADDLAARPLIIKTPSNAYRLPFLRALFPNADLQLLHLTRNVAASVNGLYDGWRFPGFWSQEVGGLDIHHYTDEFPEWASRWWKFDLPPGWQSWRDRPLAEVCGFQWRSAHTAILDWLDGHPNSLRLRFEDLVGAADARERLYADLARWLEIELDEPLAQARSGALPTVMATETPRRRRWFDRADMLSPILDDPRSRTLMERLGYDPDPDTWT